MSRLGRSHEVIQNSIGDVFVENAFVAKSLEVHFQALEFDAEFVWNVPKRELSEIGLARLGTDGGKFGAKMLDGVVTLRERVFKNFQLVSE